MRGSFSPAVCLLVGSLSSISLPFPATAQSDQVTNTIEMVKELCVIGGAQTFTGGSLDADGKIRLIGGPSLQARGDVVLTKQEWTGLIGGISPEMTQIQADQANALRICLAPARDALMKQLLQ